MTDARYLRSSAVAVQVSKNRGQSGSKHLVGVAILSLRGTFLLHESTPTCRPFTIYYLLAFLGKLAPSIKTLTISCRLFPSGERPPLSRFYLFAPRINFLIRDATSHVFSSPIRFVIFFLITAISTTVLCLRRMLYLPIEPVECFGRIFSQILSLLTFRAFTRGSVRGNRRRATNDDREIYGTGQAD